MPTIPANEPVTVLFARSFQDAWAAPIARPFVAVTPPTPDDWNDFGHNLAAILYVIKDAPTAYQIRLLFDGGGRSSNRIAEFLETRPWVEIDQVNTRFCTLLYLAEYYGGMVHDLGFAVAVSALRRLGDAVVLRLEGIDGERLALLDTDAFSLAVLRLDTAYTALRRGARYLRPTPLEESLDAAATFQMRGSLPSEKPFDIDFDFTANELLGERVTVLIGRNGSGKTQMLVGLVDGLRTAYRTSEPGVAFESQPKCNRLIVFSSVASDPYPRSIPPWSGVDYQYFSMTGRGESDADAITAAITDCLRDDGRIRFQDDPLTLGRLDLLRRVVEPLGIWNSVHLPLKRRERQYDLPTQTWEDRSYYRLANAGTLNEQRKLILLGALDGDRSPLTFDPFGRPSNLSSGELAMFRFAAQAAGAVERGTLFLFDEPETHLHPNFVSDFMHILQTLLNATGSIAIIATHSVYIVREVPRQRVRVLTLDDEAVEVGIPRMQTFGASIDSISQFVFQDMAISHRYQQLLRTWLNSLGPDVSIEQITAQFGHQMNPETLSYVARLIRSRTQS